MAVAAVLVRMIVNGQSRHYPWFFAYLLVLGLESAVFQLDRSLTFPVRQGVSIVSRLVVIALETGLVLSIFGDWTVSFPGIGAFGRKLLVVICLIAAAVAASTVSAGVQSGFLIAGIRVTAIVGRAANMGFSLFLLLTLVFFRKFGGPVAPNLMRITTGMAAYVTANSASYFVATNSKHMWLANLLLPAVSVIAMAYWLLGIKASGHLKPETVGDPVRWQEAEEMNRQMQILSDAVTLIPRASRRR
jgi:hypothetical protein